MSHDCPYCTLDPAFIGGVVLENEHGLFLQNRSVPSLQGSGIIVPRAHRPTLFDLTPEEWTSTYALLTEAKRLIDQEFQPDGYNVGWNCGQVGGQHIFHAHLHVIARFSDEPYAGKGIRHWLKSEENLRPILRKGD